MWWIVPSEVMHSLSAAEAVAKYSPIIYDLSARSPHRLHIEWECIRFLLVCFIILVINTPIAWTEMENK